MYCNFALLSALLLSGASPSVADFKVPEPPGPHCPVTAEQLKQVASYRADQPVVGTHFFYWYDIESKAHFIDYDGTDALTDHPARTEGYSYKSPRWWKRELLDVMAAGIDFILPVYWGCPGDYDSWSFVGLPPLVQAWDELAEEGKRPPRVGLFYDTSTLRHNPRGWHVDLSTDAGKKWFYTTIRDFFSFVPPRMWAAIEGRPIVVLYSPSFAAKQDPALFPFVRARMRRDFATDIFLVKHIGWKGDADRVGSWGGALGLKAYGVASLGPGYDHRAVPGRKPLVVDREGGVFYQRQWRQLLSHPLDHRPKVVLVETWNELHEGTDVCDSKEFGRQYIELTAKYAKLFRDDVVLPKSGPGVAPGEPARGAATSSNAAVVVENRHFRYAISHDGSSLQLIDKRTGKEQSVDRSKRPFASVTIGGRQHRASAVRQQHDRIAVRFEGTPAEVVLKVTSRPDYVIFECVSVDGAAIDRLTLLDVTLADQAKSSDDFAACALALNLKTNVPEVPEPTTHLRALCYARFGLVGARVAVIGCRLSQMREIMKQVVRDAPELPQSKVGGPWALDAPINRGSYLFNFGGLSEKAADDWIELARQLGIIQIDFHGGQSFRFGDCRPNPKTYPDGLASLKAVIDRLHAAGIAAGLHTYAFFLDKHSRWVSPVPDPRLAKDAQFTLARPLSADATVVSVREPTGKMSTTTGFFVRNSVTLQIDDELITYSAIAGPDSPGFTQCRRGVLGTRAAAHAAGAKVHHLKECFGLFVPDPETTLFAEVAARQAEVCNTCGFDMMYFDALDGEDILGGSSNGWHYGSKFVFEVFKRLNRPVTMEMSTFHHHLWYVRGRMGAWDHPRRSHKKFIDIHCAANESVRRMFLPAHLGWWRVMTYGGHDGQPTFADDIEYLCGKCLGHDVGFSVMGVTPENVDAVPAYRRLGRIMKRYETLRRSGYFGEAIKARLRQPGKEFTLCQSPDGGWRFREAQYTKHKVTGIDGRGNCWSVRNRLNDQPVRLRIEALSSAGPYDAADNPCLADFRDPQAFGDRATAPGVSMALQPVTQPVHTGRWSGRLAARSTGESPRRGAWAKAVERFEPPLDLSKHPALGVWVHGDASGALLNFQQTSPPHVVAGVGEHYVKLDFAGWRYLELIEPEGERYSDFHWPYGSAYSIYREHVDTKQVATLGLWLNDLPAGRKTACYLGPVKALPLVSIKLKDPAITIGGKTIRFPAGIETGGYLEFRSRSDCKLYDRAGALIAEVTPRGEVPELATGVNRVTFDCGCEPAGVSVRALVTIHSLGDSL